MSFCLPTVKLLGCIHRYHHRETSFPFPCLPPPPQANTFYIFFCLSTSVHKEPFHATPKGFYFRSRTLPSVEHVLAAFKKQPVDP